MIRDAPLPKRKGSWKTILETARWFQELAANHLAILERDPDA